MTTSPPTTAPPAAPPPSTGRRRPPLRRILLGVAGTVVLLVALAALWVQHQISPGGRPGPAVEVDVAPGTSTRGIADLLASKGVISTPWLFLAYLKVHGGGPFDAGVYSVHRHEGYAAAIRELSTAESFRLTIPEGFTLAQVADRVGHLPGHSASHFLAVAGSGQVRSPYQPVGADDLQGLIFPDTYRVSPDESDAEILKAMVDRFDTVAHQVGLDQAPATVGVTPYQVVTVASMIEREAKLPEDRGLVAQVVYNRLRIGMRLQVDATVLFALGPGHATLSSADLKVSSPYNTYVVTGLPPTPIAAPGAAALQAALHPPAGNYLYYVVVQPDGKEAFSSTLAGQEANIRLARSRGLG